MDATAVEQLGTPLGQQALAAAVGHADPASLPAAQQMRGTFPAELATAALTQAELRRRAVPKFGAAAADMLFTRQGLEQASRPEVAAHHAARFRAAGVTAVLDLGCGIGADTMAFRDAGLRVTGVERDPATAAIARLNCGEGVEIVVGEAETIAHHRLTTGVGVFCDPARRNGVGRLWRVEDFSPAWSFVLEMLAGAQAVGVKLGPALPHTLVPEMAEAEWVSHRGSTVEVGLWVGGGARPGARAAMVLPGDRLELCGEPAALDVAGPGRYVYEPDGAVIRAGGVTAVGHLVTGALLDPQIAYLTSDRLVATPFASAFEVLDVLSYREKGVRRWLAEHAIGTLEIKKRGVDVDPARLRKRLHLQGAGRATLILTRTPRGAVAIMARRVPDGAASSSSP